MAEDRNNNLAEALPYPPSRYSLNRQLTDDEEAEVKHYYAQKNICSVCGSNNLTLRNYDMNWHDGDLFCENGHHVRDWDAG